MGNYNAVDRRSHVVCVQNAPVDLWPSILALPGPALRCGTNGSDIITQVFITKTGQNEQNKMVAALSYAIVSVRLHASALRKRTLAVDVKCQSV